MGWRVKMCCESKNETYQGEERSDWVDNEDAGERVSRAGWQ